MILEEFEGLNPERNAERRFNRQRTLNRKSTILHVNICKQHLTCYTILI